MSQERTRNEWAEMIRKTFRESGMSRLALAEQAGVRYAAVYQFLSGKTDIRLDTACKFGRVLGLTLKHTKRKRS